MSATGTNLKPMRDIRVSTDAASVADAAAVYIFELIEQTLAQRERCSVVLPGGSTPALCLQNLSQMPLDWNRINWYLSDERCLPQGDEERNDKMILRNLFAQAPAKAAERLHPVPAELGAEQAALDYAGILREELDHNTVIDIAVLGMGEDGHTASLFPHSPALVDDRLVVPVHGAPKPPADRVSLGLSVLSDVRHRLVLATGAGKRDVIHDAVYGDSLPVSRVNPETWFLDEVLSCALADDHR